MTPSPRQALTTGRRGVQSLTGRGVSFTHQPLGPRIDPTGLEGYYCDLSHKARWASRWGGGFPSYGPDGPLADWVIPVAQAALGYWELLLAGEDARSSFLRLADWLAEHAAPSPAGATWRIDRHQAKYGLRPGWISALGQGQAISVLLRAHATTGDGGYLRLAEAALEPLTRDVEDGGLARSVAGARVLEEYPTARPCAVLNGWIFAVLGVHELANVTGDERAVGLVDAGADGVVALLPSYDVGWWSLYSLYDHGRPDLAKPFYQRLHPILLRALHLVRPEPRLARFADRWEAQVTGPALARVTVDKLRFRLHRSRAGRARGR